MAGIETRLFRYFVALADFEHFGRAAQSLGISTPTLSHQIKKLEQQLDARLVSRSGNTDVKLTDAGRRFLPRARSVLHEIEEAEAVARQSARGEIGRIEIGFLVLMPLFGLIEKFVGGFQKKNQGIEVVLRHAPSPMQTKALVARELNFGFARTPRRYPLGLRGFVVQRERMLIALHRDNPLAKKPKISHADLRGEAFVHYAPEFDTDFWRHFKTLEDGGEFTPRISAHAKDVVTILACISAGFGVAIVATAFRNMTIPNVVYREFSDHVPTASISLIYRSDEQSPAARAFLAYMRAFAIK